MAGRLGGRAHLGGAEPRRPRVRRLQAQELRARDAALPLRGAARRAFEVLRGRRRDRALPAPQRLPGDPPDGLRRVRAPGREPRDPYRRAAARVDREVDPDLPRAVSALGHLDRLVARDRHPRARLLPLDAVALPPDARARPRVPHRGAGPVVPHRPDGARQRAGDRRALRALRQRGRLEAPRAVVLPHHRVRRPPAVGLRAARVVARPRRHDAAQLDRSFGGGRGRLPLRGRRPRLPGLHDAPRHALRRHLLRARPGAPGDRAADRRQRRGPRRAGLCRRGGAELDRGAQRRGPREDGRGARPHRHQPRQRRADPDVRRRLRVDGLRHRGADGGAGARRARLRVREEVRPRDPPRGRAR